jgi:hypothetical protein
MVVTATWKQEALSKELDAILQSVKQYRLSHKARSSLGHITEPTTLSPR